MAAKPQEAGNDAAKPKSSKLLLIIIIVLLLLLAGGGAAAFFLIKKKNADAEGGADHGAATEQAHYPAKKPGVKPEFLPIDNLVVNLADPGGTRFVQVGITLQLEDAATAESVKTYMPAIRNGILLLVSRSTSDELLIAEGKEKLAADVLEVVREEAGLPAVRGRSPVQAVLFSSFIVQ